MLKQRMNFGQTGFAIFLAIFIAHPALAQQRHAMGPEESAALHAMEGAADSVDVVTRLAKLSESGNSWAMARLADMYKYGMGLPKDPTKALTLYEQSAARDCPDGLVGAANMYMFGKGVTHDYPKGVAYLQKAYSKGDPAAACSLGLAYLRGFGVPCNSEYAFRYFYMAAMKSHPPAQFNLAECYRRGEGVAPNLGLAEPWYRRTFPALRQSGQHTPDTVTAYCLATMYANGRGTSSNKSMADRYYKLAIPGAKADAATGDIEAMSLLGEAYEEGNGVEANKSEAMRWYKLAADKGDGQSAYRLKRLSQPVTSKRK